MLLWRHHGEGEASCVATAPPPWHTPKGVGEPETATAASALLLLLLPVVELVEEVSELIRRGHGFGRSAGEGQRGEAADGDRVRVVGVTGRAKV